MDTFEEALQHIVGVDLRHLEPLTILLVWTWHSVYRIIVAAGTEVLVQGGPFFLSPTPVHVDGMNPGNRVLSPGWIGVGQPMALRVSDQVIVTTPVVAIATERRDMLTVH